MDLESFSIDAVRRPFQIQLIRPLRSRGSSRRMSMCLERRGHTARYSPTPGGLDIWESSPRSMAYKVGPAQEPSNVQ